MEDPSDVRHYERLTGIVDDVASFGRRLRAEGLMVGPPQLTTFARALGFTTPQDAYWVGRAVLTTSPAEIPAYDRAFLSHYGQGARSSPSRPHTVAKIPDVALETPDGSASELGGTTVSPASSVEQLRHKRFDHCTPQELAHLTELMNELTWNMPPRATRRRVPARRGRIDIARTVRRSMRLAGDAEKFQRHSRRLVPRRLVLVLDVSGSMSAHSRALLIFAHAALSSSGNWEAFCFGTRLTRITDELLRRSPDAALEAAAETVLDWDGGTRIGNAMKALVDGWGQTRVLRNAVVIVCSDGLDRGEPDVLATQMSRLQRLSREIIWLNPLKSTAGYEPIARGMAAAMPYIDLFLSGNDLASLESLSRHLARFRAGRHQLTDDPV